MNSTAAKSTGDTLMIRLGSSIRAHQPYFPPRATMEEHLRFSDAHDKRVLFLTSAPGVSIKDSFEHILIHTAKSPLMLIGDIIGGGRPYDPKKWNHESAYQAPQPWSEMPARYWFAIDNLAVLEDFKPDDYLLLPSKEGDAISLLSDFNYRTKIPFALKIRPRES